MKKVLKILSVSLLTLLALVIVLPALLKGKVEATLKNTINKNINATLDFDSATLSLLKHFPNATVEVKNSVLVNQLPFEGDTLFAAETVALTLALHELFKGGKDPIRIQRVQVDRAKLHLKTDETQNTNYAIAKQSDRADSTTKEKKSTQVALALESYAITNTEIRYEDTTSGMRLALSEVHHSGTGDLSLEKSELNTTTQALVSLAVDSTTYLNAQRLALDARVGIDFTKNRYTFLENKALINQLPLVFEGFVQVNEDHQNVDITFKTPSSAFKHFLGAIPEAYSKSLEAVQTAGTFEVDGHLKGVINAERIPTFHINIDAENASFHYPELTNSVQNLSLHAEIDNTTGLAEDTAIDLKKLSFTIDQDTFTLRSHITELLGNPKVNAHINGTVNLANLAQAYPLPSAANLKGLLKADITTAFDQESIEKKQYQRTKTRGNLTLTEFEYPVAALKQPIHIDVANLTFTPQTASINTLKGKMGATDFSATGTLNNLLGCIFNDEKIEGRFKVNSNTVVLDDFKKEDNAKVIATKPNTSTASEEKIKIPAFLDCTLHVTARNLIYDNLSLKNVTGTLHLKDETATLDNVTSDLFGGTLGLSGTVSTQKEIPTFSLDLKMNRCNISESFASLDLFKVVAPLTQALQGQLNSDIAITGNLKDDLIPNLATISGDWKAQLVSAQIDTKNAPLVSTLNHQLPFLHLEDWSFNDLKTSVRFTDGAVTIQPFTLTHKDIAIEVAGGHTFDQQLHYTTTLQLPAHYLGKEVTQRLPQVDENTLKALTLPVIVKIEGSYTQPIVRTDLTTGMSQLTTQLIELQAQKLVRQGRDKAKDLLSAVVQKKSTDSSTTNTSELEATLGRLLHNTSEDTVTSKRKEDPIIKTARSIFGGLLGTDKKDEGQ